MYRYWAAAARVSVSAASTNISSTGRLNRAISTPSAVLEIAVIQALCRRPDRMRSIFRAPRFWPE